MFIERLALRAFRNIARAELEIRAATVVLIGDNGAGKTNTLEALYLCATGRAFHPLPTLALLGDATQTADIRARFHSQGVRHEVEVKLAPRRRSVRVDDRALRQVSQLLGLVNVVAFFADDLRVVKDAPEYRRRFLDRAVAGGRPAFVETAQAYQKVLRSRNALLRRGSGGVRRDLLTVCDEQLVSYGTALTRWRAAALRELTPHVQLFAAHILGSRSVHLALETGFGGSADVDDDVLRERFAHALQQATPRDIARGLTHVGPHRADLRLLLNARDARLYASQGQQRALVLSLKMAELTGLKERVKAAPLLLLDDVSSELDAGRNAALFRLVAQLGCQTWVSTTGAVKLPLIGDFQAFHVSSGVLSPRPGASFAAHDSASVPTSVPTSVPAFVGPPGLALSESGKLF